MAYDGSIKIDTDISTKNYSKGLSKIASATKSGMKIAAGAIGVATTAVVAMGTAMFKSASEFEATEAKFSTVFGNMKSEADEFIGEFQKLTPATKAEARNMASGIQDLLIPMGFAREEATGMTKDTLKLVGALTNFNSGTHTAQDVSNAFQSALTGSYESLKRLGIQANTATIEQKALEMGLISAGEEMTAQVKAQALLKVATEQSGDALAAYNIKSLDTKSKLQILQKSFTDLGASIGEGLLAPAMEEITYLNGLISELQTAFNNDGISGFFEKIGEIIPQLVTKIAEQLPMAINMGTALITNFVQGIVNNREQLGPALAQGVTTMIEGITTLLPIILDAGVKLIISLVQGLTQQAPTLIPAMLNGLLDMLEVFPDNIEKYTEAGINLILALIKGIINAIPILIARAPTVIFKMIGAWYKQYHKIYEIGINILSKLWEGISSWVGSLLGKIKGVIDNVIESFKGLASDMVGIGSNLVKGLWNGIKNVTRWLWSKITGFCGGILKKFEWLFGINSPSRVFEKEIGVNLAKGIGVGFDKELTTTTNKMKLGINKSNATLSSSIQANVEHSLAGTKNEIVVNSNLNLDGEKVAQNTSKHLAMRKLQYGV